MPAHRHKSQSITNRHSPSVRRIRSLQDRQARERTGLFFIEGGRFLARAMRHQVPIETLVVAPSLLTNPHAQKLVRLQRSAGTPYLEVTPEVFQHLSQAEEPQGIGAVVPQRWEPLDEVDPAAGLCWLAVQTVQSPGNMGTIIRTSEAVGGAGVIFLGSNADPFHPATVRASMGAMFSQRFVRTSVAEFAAWKQKHGCMLVGTSPNVSVDYHTVAYRFPLILLMGEERQGLPPELQTLCDLVVQIPMAGESDSLNLAVATGVMLYELFNQRRAVARSQPGALGAA